MKTRDSKRMAFLPPWLWGILGAVAAVMVSVLFYGLLNPPDNGQASAPPARCVFREFKFEGLVEDPVGNPIHGATITLERVGVLNEDCARPSNAAEVPERLILESKPDGSFSGELATINDHLYQMTIEAEGFPIYKSPNFTATFLPYLQFNKVVLRPRSAIFG